MLDVPLCIDTANPKPLEAALDLYEGISLVNSVNGGEKSLDAVLPLASQYGAAVISLCMDDAGLPATLEERTAVAEKIISRAAQAGLLSDDIIIGTQAMTVAADHKAGWVALETIKLIVREYRFNTKMGASNISFGLPERKFINAASMSIQVGLTCPITNPLVTEVNTAILAADLSLGKDEFGLRFFKAYRKRQKS